MTLHVLPRARTDMRKAFDHLNKENASIAHRFLDVLENALELIERNPHVGRPNKTNGVREWSVPNWPYVIPYRIVGQDIEVLRVWHTSRNRPKSWQ